ncbi:MAG: TatD family hydrolase [Candidatus Nanoarchaeia archaeon]|nr:TatD family hydrolase [Candidatus Nanoarchaeia archaeon]
MLIDDHAHLDFFPEKDLDSIINGFNGIIITNSVNLDSMKKNLEIIKKYKNVKLALGIYPLHCLEISEEELDKEIKLIKENKDKIVALGEIGLDFKESLEKEKQIYNLKKFIVLAEEIKKPLIIHSRKAELETIEILKEIKTKVVLHYFNANSTLVKKALEYGFYFSVPTVLATNKNMKKLVKIVPLDRLLTETDCPYLSPIKDQKNEPFNVKYSIKIIAEIKNISEKEVEDQIYKNYLKIFS